MPELPDVETWKRYVDAASLHRRIRRVEVDAPRMLKGVSGREVAEALEGTDFEATDRHGKHLFVELGAGGWLMLHFGMTGYLRYRETRDLYQAMHHVLGVAIECQAEPERMPDSWILPRRSEGERCRRCRGEVRPIRISGRMAYYCPACQGG